MTETAEKLLTQWPITELARVATNSVDAAEMAHYELSQRGYNKAGEYVTEELAKQDYLFHWG